MAQVQIGTTIPKDIARMITKPTQDEVQRMLVRVNGKRLSPRKRGKKK